MRRFFAKNILFVVTVNLLVKPLWIFMIDRTVQNTVGHEDYGTYQALMNLGIIFQIILDFGITSYNSTTLAQNPQKLRQIFPAMLSARALLGIVYILLVGCIGYAIGYRNEQLWLMLGVLLLQSLNSIMIFMRSNVSGLHQFKADGILSVMDRLLALIVCSVLLFVPAFAHHFRIGWFVAVQVCSYALAILVAIYVLKKISNVRLRFSLDYQKIIEIIKSSLPYASLIFLMAIYTRADTLLVDRLCVDIDKEQAGIYAAAYRLLDMGNMVGIMFALMLLPVFGRMIAQKQDVQPIVRLCANLLLPISFLVAIGGVLYGSEIMHFLYKHTQDKDKYVFAWLMLSFPAFCLSNIYSTLLTANGSLKLLNRLALLGVVVNLTFNFWLIPQYLALGAAVTTCITQTMLAIGFVIFSGKQLKLTTTVQWVLSFVGYFLIMAVVGYSLQWLPIGWMGQLIVFAIIGAGMMFLFRFVSIKPVTQLFNRD